MHEDFSLGDDPRGGVGTRDGRCPSCLRRLRQATPPPTALRAPTRPAPDRLPIALLGLPAPPPGGRLPTAVAAVPRLRHHGREGLAAAFQQTSPRPRPWPTRRLRRIEIWSIVGRAHGRRLSSSAGQVSEESFYLSSEANARLLRPRLPPHLVTLLKTRDGCHRARGPATAGPRQWLWPPATPEAARSSTSSPAVLAVSLTVTPPHSRLGQSPAVPNGDCGPAGRRPDGPVSNRRQHTGRCPQLFVSALHRAHAVQLLFAAELGGSEWRTRSK